VRRVKAENDWTSQQVARFPDRLRGFCSVKPAEGLCARGARALPAIEPAPRPQAPLRQLGCRLDNTEHVDRAPGIPRGERQPDGHPRPHALVSHTKRPYGERQARVFVDELLPAAPEVTVQIAHLAGAGGFDDPLVDQALGVFIAALAKKDSRLDRVYFDVSGMAGLGGWKDKAALIATRIREIGVGRILYGSDGAAGGNLAPREAWAAFRELPLTEDEIRTFASNLAPYLRRVPDPRAARLDPPEALRAEETKGKEKRPLIQMVYTSYTDGETSWLEGGRTRRSAAGARRRGRRGTGWVRKTSSWISENSMLPGAPSGWTQKPRRSTCARFRGLSRELARSMPPSARAADRRRS
jgi:hypothetical protein